MGSGSISHLIAKKPLNVEPEEKNYQPVEETLYQQAERERLLSQTAQRIRKSLQLETILSTTVDEVRQLLQTDRVLLFEFQPDWSGVVVTESVSSEYERVLGVQIEDTCFMESKGGGYPEGRIQATEDIYSAGLTECHIQLLERFQVRANLVVPILQTDRLWGLLVAHHCRSTRQWQPWETKLLQQLATQVAIAIQQSSLYQQVRHLNVNLQQEVDLQTMELQKALAFEETLKRITDNVRDSLDQEQILHTVVEELAKTLNVDSCGTALFSSADGYTLTGCCSSHQPFPCSAFALEDIYLPEIYQQLIERWTFAFSICDSELNRDRQSVLVCPIVDSEDVLGSLHLFKSQGSSFSDREIRLVQQVTNQCAIAIRQARLYQAVQTQVDELERLNHLKDDFLSTVSHELRTPLSTIKMAADLMEVMLTGNRLGAGSNGTSKLLNVPQILNYLNVLQSECDREIVLVNDLLSLTRLEAGAEPLIVTSINLPSWLPHVLEPFQLRTRQQNQRLSLCVPSDLPPLLCDQSILERIIVELLCNACKYTPAENYIMVSAGLTNASTESEELAATNGTNSNTGRSRFTLNVVNTGVEIPDAELPYVFDKFYRVPNNDPWRYGGTGLGLALVKRLTNHLGGQIGVESGDGQTQFTLELPLSQFH